MGRLISRKVIMRKCRLLIILAVFLIAHSINAAPQDEEEKELERQLCQDKGAGEWFRLESGEDKCRDVIQCTASGLQAIRCPSGLAFDIEKQTCDWKASVKNCESKTKEKKVKPLLLLMNHCAKMDNWLAEMATALHEVFSATVTRIVMMVLMRTLAISILTPIVPHHVVATFASSLTASVPRMAHKFLVTSAGLVPQALLAKTCLR